MEELSNRIFEINNKHEELLQEANNIGIKTEGSLKYKGNIEYMKVTKDIKKVISDITGLKSRILVHERDQREIELNLQAKINNLRKEIAIKTEYVKM